MAKLADCVIVYTETQARELAIRIPNRQIIAAPNALYRSEQMNAVRTEDGPVDFIYVGRLVDSKKPDLVIEAFIEAIAQLPQRSRLIVVGDGPLRSSLEESAKPHADRIQFKGHVADWASLRDLYASSLASVSPGYVGLSITQSFSFGVPMIVARNEPHAPEIEAAIEGMNSVFFKEDSKSALAEAMVTMSHDQERWLSARQRIADDCRTRYSVELMAERLIACAGTNVGARPDRRLFPLLEPVRGAVRALRNHWHLVRLHGKLSMGKNTTIGKQAYLSPPDFMRIGDNVSIGAEFHLESNLEAGSDILISSKVAFVGNDHKFDDPDQTVFWAGRNPPSTVTLEGDNLIGFGVTIIGDVTIGRGCIVGSRAVVTCDLPPYTICVGVPARPIRGRYDKKGVRGEDPELPT
jgi:acetyltransferase-like isoleucine patch superfamily enzyme